MIITTKKINAVCVCESDRQEKRRLHYNKPVLIYYISNEIKLNQTLNDNWLLVIVIRGHIYT